MTRACTCHPDDNPPVPCAKKYALTECRAVEHVRWMRLYLDGMSRDNWHDMRNRLSHQLSELSDTLHL